MVVLKHNLDSINVPINSMYKTIHRTNYESLKQKKKKAKD